MLGVACRAAPAPSPINHTPNSHAPLHRTPSLAPPLLQNQLHDVARFRPMTATATTMVKAVWQSYFRPAAGAKAEGEEEGAEPTAKEVEEDENEEEAEDDVAEDALAQVCGGSAGGCGVDQPGPARGNWPAGGREACVHRPCAASPQPALPVLPALTSHLPPPAAARQGQGPRRRQEEVCRQGRVGGRLHARRGRRQVLRQGQGGQECRAECGALEPACCAALCCGVRG